MAHSLSLGVCYYPEHWPESIWEDDLRRMKESGIQTLRVGEFAWSLFEPREGEYDFSLIDRFLDLAQKHGMRIIMGTPTATPPIWLTENYPEVLNALPDGTLYRHGLRRHYNYNSPKYREFTVKIVTAMGERFGHHPAVVGWHISNELSGACHCELCQRAFREWLRARYGTLEKLNRAWWTGFWSKTYDSWEELRSPSRAGETSVHGLNLAWRRFVTHQTEDFLRTEMAPLRELTPHLPVTTNLMESFDGLDYGSLAGELDFTSYDSYPRWGGPDEEGQAMLAAFNYDWMRSLKQRPFALMESTPSQVNWQPVCKLKKPGMHLLSSLQAVAHGADTVQYFQWRKSRGAAEKFHGAVVDHAGHEHTRTFRDVQAVGEALEKLADLRGTMPGAKVALLFDTQNRWALEDCQGPRDDLRYFDTALEHYRALKRQNVDVDVVDETRDLTGYRLVAAPMLYMLRPGAAGRLARFVQGGGTLVCTCYTGRVDEDDLCFLGGFPGPLREVLGIWAEETDGLYDSETNGIRMEDGATYACSTMCDLIHPETARTLGRYTADFYAGEPCVTMNPYGGGRAYYVATRPDTAFLDAFYDRLLDEAGVDRLLTESQAGVLAASRGGAVFVMNFTGRPAKVSLPEGTDALTGENIGGETELPVNGIRIVRTVPE